MKHRTILASLVAARRAAALPALLAVATGCAPAALDGSDEAPVHASEVQVGTTRTLYTWFSPSRGDYYTTTDAAWAGSPGATRWPDYVFVRAEGQVLDANFPEPGTKPLYSWWNAERGDNLLTTDPAWAGAPGAVRSGYAFARVEGHVYARPVAGTLPLTLFWNSTAQDNYTTADPRTVALPSLRPGYPTGGIQGYALPPPVSQVGATSADFGYDTLRVNGARAAGTRPMLVVMVQFRDQRFAAGDDCASRRARFFGAAAPTVAGYFRENSNSRFTFRDAGCIGPVMATDLTGDFFGPDESTFAGAMTARNNNTAGEGREVIGLALANAAAAGFDFARFDANGNDVIETQELSVVMIYPGPGDDGNGLNRGFTSPSFTSAGRTLRVEGSVAILGEAANFSTTLHEITHSLGPRDVYGSGMNSEGLTLLSATSSTGPGDLRAWHLDPWHKIRLGWVEPRVMPITDEGNLAPLDIPQSTAVDGAEARRPLILYDPRRGLNEYFLVEFRNRAPVMGGGYDAGMFDWRGSSRGVAVWHVATTADHAPLDVPGIKITGGTNGRIDSIRGGDDEVANNLLTPGPDRVLQSTRAGDDAFWSDQMVVVRGVTNPGDAVARGNRGFSGLLRPDDGDFALTWLDGTASVRLRAAPASADGVRSYVEWARGARQVTARLDWSFTSAQVGTTIDLRGALGAVQNGRIPALRAAGSLVPVTVTSWSPTVTRVTIPATVAPGRYDLVMFNPSYLSVSNAMRLDVYR